VGELMVPLGYAKVDAATVLARFAQLQAGAQFAILVAESAGQIIGWSHVAWQPNLVTGGYVEIFALVVDEAFQRQGIGKQLVMAAEDWAAEVMPGGRIRLGSGAHRTEAHRFYEGMGYTTQRASYVFQKLLPTEVTEGA
jgi:GNAT superfamily N-acetyltransferase